jgi:hypothetical protein
VSRNFLAALMAQAYLLPDVAEMLIPVIVDREQPELAARARHALAWLEPWGEAEIAPPRDKAGGALARAVVTLSEAIIYHADLSTRKRCAVLVGNILAEAAHIERRRAA